MGMFKRSVQNITILMLMSFASPLSGLAAEPAQLDIQVNPKTSRLMERNDVVALKFKDYVSNPPPDRADPVSTGLIVEYASPFNGLVEPSKVNTIQVPQPSEVGVLLESPHGSVGFYDNTRRADISVPRAPLTVRFVDPRDPSQAAVVSSVSFAIIGAAVPEGNVFVRYYNVEGDLIGETVVEADLPKHRYVGRVDCYAQIDGKEAAIIHKIVVDFQQGSNFVLVGHGWEGVDRYDLAYAGFKPAGKPVRRTASEIPPSHHIEQWKRNDQAVLMTDFSKVQPASALASRYKKGKWKVIEYETADFAGKSIAVGEESDAETVTLTLNQQGWHAVYIGLGTVRHQGNRVQVKLTSDPTYARMSNHLKIGTPSGPDLIEEIFFKAADLTGQDLQIAFSNDSAVVAYVKMVPLTEDEVRRVQAERNNAKNRTMVAAFDGHAWIWPYEPRTRQDLANMFTQFKDSDFGTWWFQVGGADLVHYPSEIGTIYGAGTGQGLEVYPRPAVDRPYFESIDALIKNGIHPLKVAVSEAHRQDVEILIMTRVGAWKGAHPWEENFSSRFYENHPEWRCIDYDGTPVMYMSYAVEEVQDHVVAVLQEAVQTGADGVGVLFNRGMPMVLWEEAFVDRFLTQYGENPLDLPENDPRINVVRAEIVTQFISKLRGMLDEEQKRRNSDKRLKLAVATFANKADNDKFGLDVERWVDEELVDQIGIAWFTHHTSGLRSRKQDMDYYLRITEGTNVSVFPFVIGWKLRTPGDLLKDAQHFYRHDIDGIAVWDPKPEDPWRASEGSYWPLLSRLGDADAVRDGSARLYKVTQIPMTRFGDHHYSRWFPNTGF